MCAVWQIFPTWVAAGEEVGTISDISLEDCEVMCCQRHCHAINYRVDGSLCMMRAFVDNIAVTDGPSGEYNVFLTQEFQGKLACILID